MSVSLTIQASCTLDTVNALNFGTVANLTSIVTQSTTIAITCTNTTPYTIELSAGAGVGATTAIRKMTFGGNTINYSLYKDSGYAGVWGTGATDDFNSTGTGAQQSFTVYGRVPVQALPNPGTYTDTVAVTVTY
jgi:spore coat protein U-like protein